MNLALVMMAAFFAAGLFWVDPNSTAETRTLIAANIWMAAYWLDSQAKKRAARPEG